MAAKGLGRGILQAPFSLPIRFGLPEDKIPVIRTSLFYESFLQAEVFVLHSRYPSVDEAFAKSACARAAI
jgi:hypothetical protein